MMNKFEIKEFMILAKIIVKEDLKHNKYYTQVIPKLNDTIREFRYNGSISIPMENYILAHVYEWCALYDYRRPELYKRII